MSANGLFLKIIIKCYQMESLSLSSWFGDVDGVDITSLSDWLSGSWLYDLIDEKSGLSQIQYQERAITVRRPDHCDNITIMHGAITDGFNHL